MKTALAIFWALRQYVVLNNVINTYIFVSTFVIIVQCLVGNKDLLTYLLTYLLTLSTLTQMSCVAGTVMPSQLPMV